MKRLLLNYFLFSLIFLSLPTSRSIAQQPYELYIAINNQECTNCLNQLAELEILPDDYRKILVFPKVYQKDSVAVIRRLRIEGLFDDVHWSDSLYNVFANKDGGYESTVNIINSANGKMFRISLVNLRANVDYINSLIKPIDTLVLFEDHSIRTDGQFENDVKYIYVFNDLSKEMYVYLRSRMLRIYTYQLTDSLIQAAFTLKFGSNGIDEFKEARAYADSARRIDANIYRSYSVSEDTVWLLGQHMYVFRTDTSGVKSTDFLTLSAYRDGVLVDFALVENYIGPDWEIPKRGIPRKDLPVNHDAPYYVLTGEFLMYEGDPYFALVGGFSKEYENHFFAHYKKKRQDKFIFHSLFGRNLPDIYNEKLGYNILFPKTYIPFSAPYFSLFASDHLFSLSSDFPDIDLDLFSLEIPSEAMFSQGIWDLKVQTNYVFLIVLDMEEKEYVYLRYDVTRQQLIDRKTLSKISDMSRFVAVPKIDDFDYRYVLLPTSDSTIVRVKVVN